jgi:hypothetical protein
VAVVGTPYCGRGNAQLRLGWDSITPVVTRPQPSLPCTSRAVYVRVYIGDESTLMAGRNYDSIVEGWQRPGCGPCISWAIRDSPWVRLQWPCTIFGCTEQAPCIIEPGHVDRCLSRFYALFSKEAYMNAQTVVAALDWRVTTGKVAN